MNRNKIALAIVFLLLTINTTGWTQENLNVLPETIDGFKPNEMMSRYHRRQVQQEFDNWKGEYERRKTPEQVAEYQKRLRSKFIEAIGGLPERTPLNPKVTGVVYRDGYRVEKVIFESQPKHYVTGVLFLPDDEKHQKPYPAVLVPCGHYKTAKLADSYQTMGALLALNGMAALIFDPIDQGERIGQMESLPEMWGVQAHNMIGIGSILLGRNTARFEIWDGMRAIDYLQSRQEVDASRIGCTGNSGGGTQTSQLMALDERIIAASPSCYITNLYERILDLGPQDAEQNIYGQLAFGMDHADYLMMRAPMPILICAATDDFFDIRGTWSSFRYAKRLYTRLGFAERVDLLENDAGHNYNRTQREGIARWMARWLLKKDAPVTEPPIKLLSEEEIRCTPAGQVMLIDGARSTYDLNRDFEKQLIEHRRKLWSTRGKAEILGRVRSLAGIRELAGLPRPKVEKVGTVQRPGYRIEKLILKPEFGIYLPALLFVPDKSVADSATLYLSEKGKAAEAMPDGPIEQLVRKGEIVLAVDLRGNGETSQTTGGYFMPYFGPDGEDVYMAYFLSRSFVGMRAEDILICARWFAENEEYGRLDNIRLVAAGNVGVPALHAGALEPDMFSKVVLMHSLVSWSNLIEMGSSKNQLVNTVHAALMTYDLDNLAEALGDRLSIEQPVDAMGEPLKAE
jgi:cephalosporin-C deacetylase-like acetyl esterase